MRSIYVLLTFSMMVIAVWSLFVAYLIYHFGDEFGIWKWSWVYIDKWIKWRYGLN